MLLANYLALLTVMLFPPLHCNGEGVGGWGFEFANSINKGFKPLVQARTVSQVRNSYL